MSDKLTAVLLAALVIGVAIDTATCSKEIEDNDVELLSPEDYGYVLEISDDCFLSHFQSIELTKDNATYPLKSLKNGESLGRLDLPYGHYGLTLRDHFGVARHTTFFLNSNTLLEYSSLIPEGTDSVLENYDDISYLTIFYTDWNDEECVNKSYRLYHNLEDWYVEKVEVDKTAINTFQVYEVKESSFKKKLNELEVELARHSNDRQNLDNYVEYFTRVDFIINDERYTYKFEKEKIDFIEDLDHAIQRNIIREITNN